jgi:hypothetical protein
VGDRGVGRTSRMTGNCRLRRERGPGAPSKGSVGQAREQERGRAGEAGRAQGTERSGVAARADRNPARRGWRSRRRGRGRSQCSLPWADHYGPRDSPRGEESQGTWPG